jgi:tRNA (guanosine-2'-O-)-methyltransferase
MLRCLASGVHSFRPLTTIRLSSSSLSAGAARKGGLRSRRKERKDNQPEFGTLEWETFDFSESPKWDERFGDEGELHVASHHGNWEGIIEEEAKEDLALQKEFERRNQLWDNLDEKLIEDATNVLTPFLLEQRWERIQSIMQQRTQQVKFLYENPANPSNVFACLRTLESFGIQFVDVVIQSGKYEGKSALSQKRGMRTAMGSAKWLTMKNHLTTEFALESIKREDYHIICTDVNPSSKDVRDVDWDASGKKICVVMGNEQRGISDAVKDMADESFYLPMCGMAESFNLSVATAITCAHMSAASKDGDGPLRPGDLSEKDYKALLLKGVLNSMKPKLYRALFKKHGLVLPNELS